MCMRAAHGFLRIFPAGRRFDDDFASAFVGQRDRERLDFGSGLRRTVETKQTQGVFAVAHEAQIVGPTVGERERERRAADVLGCVREVLAMARIGGVALGIGIPVVGLRVAALDVGQRRCGEQRAEIVQQRARGVLRIEVGGAAHFDRDDVVGQIVVPYQVEAVVVRVAVSCAERFVFGELFLPEGLVVGRPLGLVLELEAVGVAVVLCPLLRFPEIVVGLEPKPDAFLLRFGEEVAITVEGGEVMFQFAEGAAQNIVVDGVPLIPPLLLLRRQFVDRRIGRRVAVGVAACDRRREQCSGQKCEETFRFHGIEIFE